MANKKTPEQKLVDALTEILSRDQLSKTLFALIKQQTADGSITDTRKKKKEAPKVEATTA